MQALDERPRGRGAELTLRLAALIRGLCHQQEMLRGETTAHTLIANFVLFFAHSAAQRRGGKWRTLARGHFIETGG